MGCSSCNKRASAAAVYPREVTLPDGSVVTVTSAGDERAQRTKAQERMRARAAERGYSVTRR
jgi:hypothetical protein